MCVLSVVEPCRTFSLVWNGRSPYVQSARRRCLHFYYYFLDKDLGLIHVKLQSGRVQRFADCIHSLSRMEGYSTERFGCKKGNNNLPPAGEDRGPRS